MTAPFNERYIAVGVTDESEGTKQGVVVQVGGLGKFTMDEHAARKLADDVLRNANYLWPDLAMQRLESEALASLQELVTRGQP